MSFVLPGKALLIADRKVKIYTTILALANIALQVVAFTLMKISSTHSKHNIISLINIFTLLAFSAVFTRAIIWQWILKLNSLTKCYLFNALVPTLLLLVSHYLFHEHITHNNILGSAIVMLGLLILFKPNAKI